MTVTSRLQHIQKDKERQKRMEIDVRWGLEDPVAIPLSDTGGMEALQGDDDDVYYYNC